MHRLATTGLTGLPMAQPPPQLRPPPPTPTPEDLVGIFFEWAEPTNRRNFAVLPYIKGITEPLTRILKEHDIQVTSRPVKTFQQHFPIHKL